MPLATTLTKTYSKEQPPPRIAYRLTLTVPTPSNGADRFSYSNLTPPGNLMWLESNTLTLPKISPYSQLARSPFHVDHYQHGCCSTKARLNAQLLHPVGDAKMEDHEPNRDLGPTHNPRRSLPPFYRRVHDNHGSSSIRCYSVDSRGPDPPLL